MRGVHELVANDAQTRTKRKLSSQARQMQQLAILPCIAVMFYSKFNLINLECREVTFYRYNCSSSKSYSARRTESAWLMMTSFVLRLQHLKYSQIVDKCGHPFSSTSFPTRLFVIVTILGQVKINTGKPASEILLILCLLRVRHFQGYTFQRTRRAYKKPFQCSK